MKFQENSYSLASELVNNEVQVLLDAGADKSMNKDGNTDLCRNTSKSSCKIGPTDVWKFL